MRTQISDEQTVPFDDIEAGEWFSFKNVLYRKLSADFGDMVAIRADNGEIAKFTSQFSLVEKRIVKIVVL